MDLKLYGAAEQKKLARYPARIMEAQKFQETIPKIGDLNLAQTADMEARMKRFLKELDFYKVVMRAAISRYKSIVEEANADCDKLEQITIDAPKGVKEDRKFSLKTSIVQTRQQVLFVEQQCKSLEEQIANVNTAEAAIRAALTQINLANLVSLLADLKLRDTEIRNFLK